MKLLNTELYQKMYLIRAAELAIQKHYMDDEMKTPMHMSMGEEAIIAGICHAMAPTDQALGTYRSHGIYLTKTMETDRFFAEMYGKVTGVAKGKGGSMHLIAPEDGLIGTSAIVGSNIPVAVGAAFANKQQQNGKQVAVFFGDGAIDEGVFWESINSACLMKLPIHFICEDNSFAVHTPDHERHGYKSIAELASQYDCHLFTSDSTDPEVIYNLMQEARAKMAKTGQPCFFHLKYYRYLEHVGIFEDFKAGYRSRDDFEAWNERDPLDLQRKKLLDMVHESDIAALEEVIDTQVDRSIKLAQAAPFPDGNVAYEDLMA